MDVPTLTYPGAFLNLPDHVERQQGQRLIELMEAAFTDAVAALSLFKGVGVSLVPPLESPGAESEEPPACPTCGTPKLPDYLQRRLPFLHARTFLYALDGFAKALTQLADIPTVAHSVRPLRDAFQGSLPSLTPLRNTVQHLEDRARGLGKRGKPLNLKPVVNNVLNFPGGGVLAFDILNGDRYGGTAADGSYLEIDVNDATLTKVHGCFQAVIEALPWQGRSRHYLWRACV